MVWPPSGRKHLSPPPMRRDSPPASRTMRRSGGIVVARALAPGLLALRRNLRRVGIVADAVRTGEGDEAAALGAADQGEPRLPRQRDAPGGEARAADQDR